MTAAIECLTGGVPATTCNKPSKDTAVSHNVVLFVERVVRRTDCDVDQTASRPQSYRLRKAIRWASTAINISPRSSAHYLDKTTILCEEKVYNLNWADDDAQTRLTYIKISDCWVAMCNKSALRVEISSKTNFWFTDRRFLLFIACSCHHERDLELERDVQQRW